MLVNGALVGEMNMLSIIKRVLVLAGGHGIKIKIGFVLGFLDGLFEGASFIALAYAYIAINRGLVENDIKIILIVLLTGLAGHWLCRYFVARFQSGAGIEMMSEQRLNIGNILKRVPMGFFKTNNLGEITTTVSTDLSFIEMYCMFVLDRVVNGFISSIVVSIFIVIYDWRIGLIILLSIIPMGWVFVLLQRRGKALSPKRQDAQADLVAATLEYIRGIEVIRSFNVTTNKAKNIVKALGETRDRSYDLEKGFVPLLSVYSLMIRLSCSFIILVICMATLNGSAEITDLFLVVTSTFVIFNPIEQTVSLTGMMRLMEASLDRLERITKAKAIDLNAKAVSPKNYDIEFRSVNFAYDRETVVKDLSFRSAQNTSTAIVGVSGSGKTTITNLIARFWDVQKGSVLIGGIDVKDLSCDSILKHISMVFQDVYLFNDTVLNNVKLGKPEASKEEIVAACKSAQCHEFVLSLAKGYETVIGEGGSTLSGGEKQRISIARAILKDAPIILLDEATSNIDPENEKSIQIAINHLIQNKTLIVIAHRLSSIRNVDNILVLDKGKLSQTGRHEDLIRQEGIYKNLWDIRQKANDWRIFS